MSERTHADGEVQASELAEIPYVADDRSEKLRDAGFTTIREVGEATADELAKQVYGLSAYDAERIVANASEIVETREVGDAGTNGALEATESVVRTVSGQDEGVPPEIFEEHIYETEDGRTLYRLEKRNELGVTPHIIPGFEEWCDATGRDPEQFIPESRDDVLDTGGEA